MHWQPLTDLSQLGHIQDISKEQHIRAVLLFKHSTRCSISAMALGRMDTKWKDRDDLPCYYLDLLNHRDISNEITRLYGVEHQSPQVLLIKNGVCIYHQSHGAIVVADIEQAIPS